MRPTGTITFLFTDIEGSTQRWDHHRAAMQEAVRLHDRVMRDAIEAAGGHVFKTVGDAFCAAFSTPEAAAAATIDAQQGLAAQDFSAVDGLRVRMAINTGTADERDGDYFGPSVNRVARLLTLAHGGQVLLAGSAAGLVRENPPLDASLVDLGTHALKDLDRQERVYQLVAPGLARDFPPLRVHTIVHQPWVVPEAHRTHYFTGRDGLLADLRDQLVQKRRAALSGLGGIGKTQTALAYATRHRAQYPNGVFWIDAETPGGITGGLVEVAKALQLQSASSNDHELVVRNVLEWLDRSDRWLMVLDNVEDRREVARFVSSSADGHVLVTSREHALPELGIPRAIGVHDLEAGEAVTFLFARTGRDRDDAAEYEAAVELASDLGALPLALEQAAAYIAETGAGFAAYLAAFRRRRVHVLERASDLVAHDTVAVTWAANFAAIERISPDAAGVLRTAAFLAPDAIPFELLTPNGGDELAMTDLLRAAGRYSLIRLDAASETFAVHRLVQDVIREALAPEDRSLYAERAYSAVAAAFPDGEFSTWNKCDRLVSHVAAVAEWARAHDVRPKTGVVAVNRAGRYLVERGRYREAVRLLECILDVGERLYGPEHPDVASTLNILATAHLSLGAHALAQTLHERALAIRERVCDPNDLAIAQTLNNLANVYFTRQQFADAAPLYRRAHAISENTLGPEHHLSATNLHNLGMALAGLDRHDEADEFLQRALAIRERVLGPAHPHYALSLSSLAAMRARRGRFAEAESLHTRALQIREAALGADHPEVAETLNDLALLRTQLDPLADVQPLHERALMIYEGVTADHPQACETLNMLADLHLKRDRIGEAEALFERALAIAERIDAAAQCALSLHGLSRVRAAQGRDSEARALLERANASSPS